jgi:hypothetical protein
MTPTPRRLAAGLLTAVTAAGLTAIATAASPAWAGPDEKNLNTTLRVCDPTGCYVAWAVRDSDGDGVCDADEIMAGTDPYDARSRPGLTVVVELGMARTLPSFEAGQGAFIAFPAEIVAAIAAGGEDPLGAFPLHGRKDAMKRAGIDADQLSTMGIDLEKDGLTLGLGDSSDGSLPMRIGGMDASLVSAGSSHTGIEHGGVKSVWRSADGTRTITTYFDGATESERPLKGGSPNDTRTTWTNPDGGSGGSATTRHQPTTMDGDVRVDRSNSTVYDSDDKLDAHVSQTVRTSPDGSVTKITETVIYNKDEEGNIVGITKVTEVETEYSDGYASRGVAVDKCDAAGENCQTVYEDYQPKEYINPDADDTTFVSVEFFEQKLVLRGAAITVVEGWSAPGFEEDPENPRNPTTIALVDDELGASYLLVEPMRITEAQPETRDDLPNPYQDGGGCWPKCT